ncbi:MAG: DUF2950 domain-containing protein [Acidobacteria bacterium]|nr:DUF2950 domain-containing protein [Acidobacteriota bacterium]
MKFQFLKHFRPAALIALTAAAALAQTASPAKKQFDSPQQAASALVAATENYSVDALLQLFGPEGKDIVSTNDPVQDKNNAAAFAARARQKMRVAIDPATKAFATISVGPDAWPLPVPIVKKDGKWSFDAQSGLEELLARRIGANELDAIQICRGFVEAQQEYALAAREVTGVTQYAQKIISTPGKRDGLFWRKPDGSLGGPISESVARAIEEGYSLQSRSAYHGYYFKVLKGQGAGARGGQIDYVIDGVMIGGFALIATPAEYGVTGIKTFLVNHDGVVYEKDLGKDSLSLAKAIDRFSPDKTWTRTDDNWPAESGR